MQPILTTNEFLFCSGVLMVAFGMRLRYTPLGVDAEGYKLGYQMFIAGVLQIVVSMVIS